MYICICIYIYLSIYLSPVVPVPHPYSLQDCGTSPLQTPGGLMDLEANREESVLLGYSLPHSEIYTHSGTGSTSLQIRGLWNLPLSPPDGLMDLEANREESVLLGYSLPHSEINTHSGTGSTSLQIRGWWNLPLSTSWRSHGLGGEQGGVGASWTFLAYICMGMYVYMCIYMYI